jgi:hypothetical protein
VCLLRRIDALRFNWNNQLKLNILLKQQDVRGFGTFAKQGDTSLKKIRSLAVVSLSVGALFSQSAFAFTFTETCPSWAGVSSCTVSSLTSNNTSASNSWNSTYNSQVPRRGSLSLPVWDNAVTNISKLSIRDLMPGYNGPILAETQDWFCTTSNPTQGCNGHIQTGENDTTSQTQITAQVNDMLSRGYTGQVLDWYGAGSTSDNAAKMIMTASEGVKNYTFAIMIDKGALNCSSSSTCTSAANSVVSYVVNTYTKSSAYQKDSSGRPIIYWFLNSFYSQYGLINWGSVNTLGSTFNMYEPDGFGGAPANVTGEYDWVNPADSSYVGGFDSAMGFADMYSFYENAMNYPNSFKVAAAYKGFDDGLAGWGSNRIIDQQCGNTWLQTFNHTGSYGGSSNYMGAMNFINAGHTLSSIMIDTWDDYEEGTETETGIDNCLDSVNVSLNGNTLSWTTSFGTDKLNSAITGTEATVANFSVYLAQEGQTNLMYLGNVACTGGKCPTHSVDVSTYGITGGPYVFYVQAVGQPDIKNVLSGPSPVFNGSSGGTTTVSSPAQNSTVSSPVTFKASSTDPTVNNMQVWEGSTKYGEEAGGSLNQTYTMATGSHSVTVESVDSSNNILNFVVVDFTVSAAASVTVSSPAHNATVGTSVNFVASSSYSGTNNIQVWEGSTKYGSENGTTLNQTYTMSPGAHSVTVEAVGSSNNVLGMTIVSFTVSNPQAVTVTAPLQNSTETTSVNFIAGSTYSGTNNIQVWEGSTKYGGESGTSLNQTYTLPAGSHSVIVEAVGSSNNILGTTTVNFTVSQPVSSINITSPAENATLTSTKVNFIATSTYAGTNNIQVWEGNTKYGVEDGTSLNQTYTLSTGEHHVTIEAVGTGNNVLGSKVVDFDVK